MNEIMLNDLKEAINNYDVKQVSLICKYANIPVSEVLAAVAARMRYDLKNVGEEKFAR